MKTILHNFLNMI